MPTTSRKVEFSKPQNYDVHPHVCCMAVEVPTEDGAKWKLYVVQHDLMHTTWQPINWRSNLIVVDEVGDVIGHHYNKDQGVVYSVEQLNVDRRKEILNNCNNNKQDGGFVMLYRCPFTEADQVMLEGAEVSSLYLMNC